MYVDVRNAARRLNISESQVRRLIKRKKLKAINIGAGKKRKAYRIKATDLEEV